MLHIQTTATTRYQEIFCSAKVSQGHKQLSKQTNKAIQASSFTCSKILCPCLPGLQPEFPHDILCISSFNGSVQWEDDINDKEINLVHQFVILPFRHLRISPVHGEPLVSRTLPGTNQSYHTATHTANLDKMKEFSVRTSQKHQIRNTNTCINHIIFNMHR